VGDILVLFGSKPCATIRRTELVNRPGMHHHEVREYSYSWGTVLVQQSKGSGFAPAEHDGRLIIPVGRPTVRQYGIGNEPNSFARWILESQESGDFVERAVEISDAISGMYAIFEFTQDRVAVLTDHMGFRPVYIARDESGRVLGIGTHVESLAAATEKQSDIDLVSIGELVTYNYITFPFTSRRTIRELDPCSLTVYSTGDGDVTSKVLWEPIEPKVFPGKTEIRQRLNAALREAGDDISRGCQRVGVLLSGGIDSRAVISVIPQDRLGAALTYVTRENRESRVAGDVALAVGSEQILVQRDEDYFPNLVSRGLGLIGMELRGNCHGLCIADNDLADSFDVIIGGQLSDTLLKEHFMPLPRRDSFRERTMKSRLREIIRGPMPAPIPSPSHTTGRESLESELTAEILEQVRARRNKRMKEVQRVRPTTADEWHRFWPCSRQDDSAHTLGNTRLMCSDTLFAHQAIVEVSQDFAPQLRVDGALTDSIFMDLCGNLGQIMNANTGLPANASKNSIRKKRKKERKLRQRNQSPLDGWNDVQTSWADPVVMQRQSEIWNRHRTELASSPAADLLSKVIRRGGEKIIGAYQEDLPSTTNHIVMQLAIWLNSLPAGNQCVINEASR
jgi:hypothetical protein